jgi:hypothetical protein
MKRLGLLSVALVLSVTVAGAQAGITMGAMNGWMFSFSGNVNAFLTYTDPSCGGGAATCTFNGSLIPAGADQKVVRIQTGLAPAFAIFEAKGKEGGMDLSVHFGFAPEIQSPDRLHDTCGGALGLQCGTQIDMREVYLTAGGSWGQILAGRAIGVYQKENLLTDMTVFGVGLTGGAAGVGTTLGHIGTGYTYPNFNAQITYSTASNKEGVFTAGLFDPSVVLNPVGTNYSETQTPRLEAEYVYTMRGKANSPEKLMLYASGLYANVKDPVANKSISPWGLALGGEWASESGIQADLSGFYQSGVGSTLMFDDNLAVDALGDARTSYGYLAQLMFQARDSKWKFGASYGDNHVDQTSDDKLGINNNMKDNSDITVAATYMYTKSFRGVFELDFGSGKAWDDTKVSSTTVAAGLMLFF